MIRRGETWGQDTVMPVAVVEASSDALLARAPSSLPVFVSAGDIARSIGNPSRPSPGATCTEVAIDAMQCTIHRTGSAELITHAASSVVIGQLWRGRHIIVSNAGWVRDSNVAPRAHPNDGIVEMMTLSEHMSLRQRFLASRKMRTGTHIPHPDIVNSRETQFQITKNGTERLVIDGVRVHDWTQVAITVLPDYWRVLL